MNSQLYYDAMLATNFKELITDAQQCREQITKLQVGMGTPPVCDIRIGDVEVLNYSQIGNNSHMALVLPRYK